MYQAACRICGGQLTGSLRVREMMFGTREQFGYHQCADCGCLQIDVIPADIGRHYPDRYYSYGAKAPAPSTRRRRGWRRRLILGTPFGPVMRLFSRGDGQFHDYRALGVRPGSRVLDVGAGSGKHVAELRDAGVVALGVDAYVPEDIHVGGQLLVKKATLAEMSGVFDLIAFHHSLEHMADQAGVLAEARRLLSPKGRIFVRVPTVSSEAFEAYGKDWVNLDAPRHFYLHSHRSLQLVAERAGLRLERLSCDSVGQQFAGSEQYRMDVPLTDPRGATLFSRQQRRAFEERARELNRALRGDALCAVMSAA